MASQEHYWHYRNRRLQAQWRNGKGYEPLAYRLRNAHSRVVPGCISDPRGDRLNRFDRWFKRPDKAQRLFWRTHPELYAKLYTNRSK